MDIGYGLWEAIHPLCKQFALLQQVEPISFATFCTSGLFSYVAARQ